MTANPAPGIPSELFAESARNSSGLPSEEAIARWLCAHEGHTPEQVEALWTEWLDNARELLGMFRPAFAHAEADAKVFRINATSKLRSLEARAISAEAALAGLRQCILDSAVICDHRPARAQQPRHRQGRARPRPRRIQHRTE